MPPGGVCARRAPAPARDALQVAPGIRAVCIFLLAGASAAVGPPSGARCSIAWAGTAYRR
eukprot:10012168-Lingulodinium_polyedra.AAC.1